MGATESGRGRSRHRQAAGYLLLTVTTALASAGAPAYAHAQGSGNPPAVAQAEQVAFDIPPQSLVDALALFGRQSGMQVSVDAGLIRGKSSPGVTGSMRPEQALRQILAGTGITYRLTGGNTAMLEVVAGNDGATTLDPITVQGQAGPPLTAVLGNLPPAYAGGQVATGGQLGMLGNRDVMDTPFNQTNYTSKLIQDQQARSINDVLANDPSLASNLPRGANREQPIIRGFNITNAQFGINGLYGLVGDQGSFGGLEVVERVELLKGPSALLNGQTFGVGGTVNMITKRATDEPITQLTTSYVSRSQLGGDIDIGHRYGENNEFGVRYNGSYRNGDLPVDQQSEENRFSSFGLDYRGERVRLAADLIYRHGTVEPVLGRMVIPSDLASMPGPPKTTNNWSAGDQTGENKIAIAQGEVDLTDKITAYASVGAAFNSIDGVAAGSGNLSATGDFSTLFVGIHDKNTNLTGQAGVRGTFRTGLIEHKINFNASKTRTQLDRALAVGPTVQQNIYNPVVLSVPNIALPDPRKAFVAETTCYGVADTLSIFDERVQVVVGIRRQQVFSESFDTSTGDSFGSYDSAAWTPAFAAILKPLQNVSLYANYIEALEEGVAVDATFANAGAVFPPFRATQKEMGVKVDLGHMTTTVSAFEITRPSALTVPGTPLPTLTDNGEVRNRGIEVNVFGELTDGVRLLGGITFYDATQVKTQNGTFDGNKAAGVPDMQIALSGEWDTPFLKGFTLTGRVLHQSEAFADSANRYLLPDYTRLDLGARYSFDSPWNDKPVTLRFAVENVFDTSRWVPSTASNQTYLDSPRTFLVSTTFNF